jgi:plastocyanin
MKKSILLFVFTLCLATISTAKIHIITCQNGADHFLPLQVKAAIGDTIRWKWVSGGHIVGPIKSTDIPTGAPTMYSIIDANHLSYDYVLKVVGNYKYDCHPANPHNETATLVVSSTTASHQLEAEKIHLTSSPNPSNGHFQLSIDGTLSATNAKLEIVNLYGQSVYRTTAIRTKQDIYLQKKGIYFAKLSVNNATQTRKIIIE